MTISQIWQAGAEFNSPLLEFTSRSSTNFVTSSTAAKTGSYSFRTTSTVNGSKVLDDSIAQFQIGFFVYHEGVPSNDVPNLVTFRGGGNSAVTLYWDGDASTLRVYVGAGEVASALSAAFAATTTWVHVGVDIKLHASGWIYVYIDGTQVIGYTGDTTGGASSVDTLVFGSRNADGWNTYLRIDDITLWETDGEASAIPVADDRYERISANGNGGYSQWVGIDTDSTDNYLHVDEVTPDDDTSYVESDTFGHRDSYTLSDITPPDGYEIEAVIPWAVAKKMSAGSTNQLKLYTKTTVSGSDYSATSAGFDPGTSYGLIWERRPLRPDGGAWDDTTVDATDVGVEIA